MKKNQINAGSKLVEVNINDRMDNNIKNNIAVDTNQTINSNISAEKSLKMGDDVFLVDKSDNKSYNNNNTSIYTQEPSFKKISSESDNKIDRGSISSSIFKKGAFQRCENNVIKNFLDKIADGNNSNKISHRYSDELDEIKQIVSEKKTTNTHLLRNNISLSDFESRKSSLKLTSVDITQGSNTYMLRKSYRKDKMLNQDNSITRRSSSRKSLLKIRENQDDNIGIDKNSYDITKRNEMHYQSDSSEKLREKIEKQSKIYRSRTQNQVRQDARTSCDSGRKISKVHETINYFESTIQNHDDNLMKRKKMRHATLSRIKTLENQMSTETQEKVFMRQENNRDKRDFMFKIMNGEFNDISSNEICTYLNEKDDFFGMSQLHWAVKYNNIEFIKKLIEFKINPLLTNKIGQIPLHVAVILGFKEAILTLISYSKNSVYKYDYNYMKPYDLYKTHFIQQSSTLEFFLLNGMVSNKETSNRNTNTLAPKTALSRSSRSIFRKKTTKYKNYFTLKYKRDRSN